MPVARLVLVGGRLLASPCATPLRALRRTLDTACCRCRRRQPRSLHTSRPLGRAAARDDDAASLDHYARLGLRPDASPAEIKKSFYALSKTHHPDVNRADPRAARTFSLLSESYTVLSDPSRRAAYDRDHMRRHQQQRDHAARRGSYSSTAGGNNPAGGREPSGLSRRRGTFRGPAPSFYRNGGWGAHAETRRRAHEESTGTGGASANSSSASSSSSSGAFGGGAGGMGPGSSPFHHPDLSTPHFDKDSHTRTHKNQDRRRWQRSRRAMGDDDVEFEPQTSVAVHFLIVSCILGATILTPFVYLQMTSFGKRKKERE